MNWKVLNEQLLNFKIKKKKSSTLLFPIQFFCKFSNDDFFLISKIMINQKKLIFLLFFPFLLIFDMMVLIIFHLFQFLNIFIQFFFHLILKTDLICFFSNLIYMLINQKWFFPLANELKRFFLFNIKSILYYIYTIIFNFQKYLIFIWLYAKKIINIKKFR